MPVFQSAPLRRNHDQRVMLLRALSKLGLGSRQQAKRAIHAGRVSVNGKVITSHTHWVNLQRDRLALDEQPVRGAEKLVYLMLNKPAGYVTTRRDNLNRPTVFELLAAGAFNHAEVAHTPSWIFPIGRLDYNSEGLLLFTNDGELSDALTSPERHVPKVYRVRLDHLPPPDALRRLETGIRILDYVTLPAKIALETSTPAAALNENQTDAAAPWLRITICEGKNRQVRRMFAALGCEVRQLIRVRFGPLELGGLPVGHWRYLTAREIAGLDRAVAT
ncbi:MAG: Ribosomal large subunit pseudouridine synthase B [bacterium]|nr:Ribosomal large subunit pseudouridine synthase B [bacterium]